MIVGHTHRVSNLMRGDILITEGINAGATLLGAAAAGQGRRRGLGRRGDARRQEPRRGARGPTCRRSSTTPTRRPPCCATRSSARRQFDILRDPTRLNESAMGNMVADAMREKYPGVEAAHHELRRPAAGPPVRAAERRREANGEITWGEVFAVLPFGNRDGDPDPHGRAADGRAASTASRRSATRPVDTGRFPQVSGLKVTFHCDRDDGRWSTASRRRPSGPAGPLTPVGPDRHRPLRHERLHVHRR